MMGDDSRDVLVHIVADIDEPEYAVSQLLMKK